MYIRGGRFLSVREERRSEEVWEVGEVRCIRLLHLMSEPSPPPSVDDLPFLFTPGPVFLNVG